MTSLLLDVRDLGVRSEPGGHPVLRGVDLQIAPGETLGVVGESGAGKSTIAKALLGLLPRTLRMTTGRLVFEGRDLRRLTPRELHRLCGDDITLIPQDPLSALNPGRRIERQLTDGLRTRRKLPRREARERALGLLEDVQIRDPERVMRCYPHELSGGMRQRILIAAAFALKPKLIIADEPTTALDVTVQKQVLRVMRRLQVSHGTAVMFITHDLGVVAQLCDRLVLMFAGSVVEAGPAADVLAAPSHPYTRALIAARPRCDRPEAGLQPVPDCVIAALRADIAGRTGHG